jgi:hypothetical protein
VTSAVFARCRYSSCVSKVSVFKALDFTEAVEFFVTEI